MHTTPFLTGSSLDIFSFSFFLLFSPFFLSLILPFATFNSSFFYMFFSLLCIPLLAYLHTTISLSISSPNTSSSFEFFFFHFSFFLFRFHFPLIFFFLSFFLFVFFDFSHFPFQLPISLSLLYCLCHCITMATMLP